MADTVRTSWQELSAQAARHAATCPLQLEELDLGNAFARYAQLSMPSLEGGSLQARVIVPTTPGTHPVMLTFHDATRGVRGWHHLTRFVALGYAVLALENRAGVAGVLVDEPLTVGDGLGVAMRVVGDEPAHTGRTLDDATHAALRATYLDVLVLAHAAARLEGLDATHLLTWGEGLGGGLALIVAALCGARVACALNPLPAALDPSCADVDVATIAAGLSCPVLMGTCLLDLQASPEAQDEVARGLSALTRLRYPRYAHERVNAFEDEMLSFLVSNAARLS